jgi:DNA-binding XRE family transcriptional regulator
MVRLVSEHRNEHPSGKSPVGRNIFVRRERAGLTQVALAELVSVTPRTVQNWEYGHFIPKWDQLLALARTFECSVADLFERRTDEREPNGPVAA